MYPLRVLGLFLVFLSGSLLSRMVLPRISLVSFRKKLFDRVDSRKLHTAPIPRLGGIAFFPCISVSVSLAVVFHNLLLGSNALSLELTTLVLAMFSGLFLIYLTGMMDDLIGVRYRSKFIVEIISSSLLVVSGLHFDNFYGLFGLYEAPAWFSMPFSVFILVFILNAVNLIGGIGGLASGLSGIAFLAFGTIFALLGWWFYSVLSFASLGVLVPFFYYNVFGQARRGRKIFMGDTGSLTIGLLLGTLAIRLSMSDPSKDAVIPGAIVVAFSCLMVPMLGVVRVVLHRVRNGRNPFMPDTNHIHHKFIALGFSHRRSMVTILSVAFVFAACNVLAIHYLSVTALFLLGVLAWTVMHLFLSRGIRKRAAASGRPAPKTK